VGIGVFVELERNGYAVGVSPFWARTFGEWRVAPTESVDATVLLIGTSASGNRHCFHDIEASREICASIRPTAR
jgi:hypothetical protein